MQTNEQLSTPTEQETIVIMARIIARHLYEIQKKKKANKPKNTYTYKNGQTR